MNETHVKVRSRHFEWNEWKRWSRAIVLLGVLMSTGKAAGLTFRFLSDPERKAKWIAAVKCENWTSSEHTWICSQHFITGEKSNNPLAPN